MLASVYSYHVMVKSVSSCCVRGRWVFSDPVTYKSGQNHRKATATVETISKQLEYVTKGHIATQTLLF